MTVVQTQELSLHQSERRLLREISERLNRKAEPQNPTVMKIMQKTCLKGATLHNHQRKDKEKGN